MAPSVITTTASTSGSSASIRRLGDMLLPPPPLMLNRWNSLGSMMSSASTSAPPCTMRTRPTFRAQAEVFQRAERARNRILAIIGRVHRAAGVQNDRQGPALSIAARQHDIGAVAGATGMIPDILDRDDG